MKLRGAAGEINVARPVVVGVVNATPDSFSDRGDRSIAGSVNQVHEHLEAGAGVIEVGGESNVTNRPPVTAAIEIDRILPVVEAAVAAGAIVSVPYAASSSAGSRARAMGGASVGSVRAVRTSPHKSSVISAPAGDSNLIPVTIFFSHN